MKILFMTACLGVLMTAVPRTADIWDAVEHHDATNNGVKIHYVALGQGPLIVMIHGFPDFWYTWRRQMEGLSDRYRMVAVDLRGYDLSDKPTGVAQYAMPLLVGDIAAVIEAEHAASAIVVGHDWGGAIAWNVAMRRPELVSELVILNLPHPAGLGREIANNPQQRQNSAYAFRFQQPDAAKDLTIDRLTSWITDAAAKPRYEEAFKRSDFEAMLNYYKANYPRPDAPPATPAPAMPKVKVPVLEFHGLEDQALLPGALNDTWQWLEKDLTLVTIPGAGHFVQQDAADLVTETMRDWLARRVDR